MLTALLMILPLQIYRLVVTVRSRIRRMVLWRVEGRKVYREAAEAIGLAPSWLSLVLFDCLAVFWLKFIRAVALDVGGECPPRGAVVCVLEVSIPTTYQERKLMWWPLLSPLRRSWLHWSPLRSDHHDIWAVLDSRVLDAGNAGALRLAGPIRGAVHHQSLLYWKSTTRIIVRNHCRLSEVARPAPQVWLRLLRPPGSALE